MDSEQSALKCFEEELGELAIELLKLQNQVSKAIRFGIDEQRDLPTSNRERIESEWQDLLGCLAHLKTKGIKLNPDLPSISNKMCKIVKYENYSRELGKLQD